MAADDQQPAQTSNPMILIVDDDLSSIRILEMGLKRAGYQTVVTPTGREALEIIQSHRPDLILMDDFLPVLAGSELCRRLKYNPETATIPIILASAGERIRDQALMQEIRVDYVLSKPFNLTELIQIVGSLLG
ncbi:MAG TPA: response regulator [Phototrophicaceae bacterium]|nr:response regulator [Phototrophicaceae bacterium]